MTKCVALNFDYWPDAFETAFNLMHVRGLPGTYFVDHRTIDVPNSFGPGTLLRRDHLTQLKKERWTIGAYSGENMVNMFVNDRNVAMDFFTEIKTTFRAKGFEVLSLAPNQRAWSEDLRNVCVNLFARVRSAAQDVPQTLPVQDPLWIDKGGVPSLDNGDTPASVNARIDDFLNGSGNLLQFVVHKIGAIPADHTVDTATFVALLDRLKIEQDAGNLKVVGYDDGWA